MVPICANREKMPNGDGSAKVAVSAFATACEGTAGAAVVTCAPPEGLKGLLCTCSVCSRSTTVEAMLQ